MNLITRIFAAVSILFYLISSNGVLTHNHIVHQIETDNHDDEHNHNHVDDNCSVCFFQHTPYDDFTSFIQEVDSPYELVLSTDRFIQFISYTYKNYTSLSNKSPPIIKLT